MIGFTPVFFDLPSISLGSLDETAALLTRHDRKYVVDDGTVARLISAMSDSYSVLEISGNRWFDYESIYFDTPDLSLYRAAAHRRRQRYKIRTRTYEKGAIAVLEVKSKHGRGHTVKNRREYPNADRTQLTDDAHAFIESVLGRPGVSDDLQPMLTTNYVRSTVVHATSESRVTIDQGLVCTDWEGSKVELAGFTIESKSSSKPSPTDRWLWSEGIRPIRISKYGTALAAMHPDLPQNKWHRTLQSHFASSEDTR